MLLTIELVPKTCHFKNVRSEVTVASWDKLRKECYKAANYTCEVCGGKGDNHPVECHEIWEYDDKRHTQTLAGLIALCPACHEVKHLGLAQIKGNYERALLHFVEVNDIPIEEAKDYIFTAFAQWAERSEYQWELDISWLNKKLAPPKLRGIHCCGCNKEVQAYLTNGKEIYPHRKDLHKLPFWKCKICNNYVGCHHKTDDPTRPLGYIPTEAIRMWRGMIHEALDPFWKSGEWTRSALYSWMSNELGWKFHVSCIRSVKEAEEVYLLIQRIPKTKAEALSIKNELDRLFGD